MSWHVSQDGESHKSLPQNKKLQAVNGYWQGESILSMCYSDSKWSDLNTYTYEKYGMDLPDYVYICVSMMINEEQTIYLNRSWSREITEELEGKGV